MVFDLTGWMVVPYLKHRMRRTLIEFDDGLYLPNYLFEYYIANVLYSFMIE